MILSKRWDCRYSRRHAAGSVTWLPIRLGRKTPGNNCGVVPPMPAPAMAVAGPAMAAATEVVAAEPPEELELAELRARLERLEAARQR